MAYALAGFSNFFLRRPFVSDAVFALVVMATLAAFVIFQFTQQMESLGTMAQVDWQLVPAGILILFALVDSGGAGAGVFDAAGHDSDAGGLLGVVSGRADVGLFLWPAGCPAAPGGLRRFTRVIPNWQLFWLADAMETGQKHVSLGLRRQGVWLCGWLRGRGAGRGAALFEERELS